MRYIIDFKDAVLQHEIDNHILSTANTHNIRIIKHYKGFGNVFLIEADVKPELTDLIESVIEDENNSIKLLGVDLVLTDSIETTTFDIEDTKNWWKVASVNNLDFDETIHTHTIRGFNSTVYILDSGIEENHPEFVGVDVTLLHSFTDNFTDTKGHGTGLASLISGKTCGLTGASLKIVKIYDVNKPTLQSDLLHAFDQVLADYTANGRKPSVANLSWGIPYNSYINSKIQVLINQGIFVVVAAGNAGVPIENVTPASIANVLTVGSYDQSLKPCDFSNYTE
jgi:subtilisin family serine protease